MAKKLDAVQERITRRAPSGSGEDEARLAESGSVVMRDESDEIIDTLKRQLAALQGELSQYRGSEDTAPAAPGTPRKPRRGGRARLVEEFNAGFAPHLAQRLQVPTEELTQRLERLIAQVNDPELKAELELARETAHFLSSTFHRIQDHHQLLTESLVAERIELHVSEFFAQVTRTLEARGLKRAQIAQPEAASAGAGGTEDTVLASPLAAATVLSTLADLASGVFGGAVKLTLGGAAAEAGSRLRMRVETDRPWRGVEGQEVSAVVFRPGVRAASVVDVLYVEKLIELQGGRLTFFREAGQVRGFEVHWPVEAQ